MSGQIYKRACIIRFFISHVKRNVGHQRNRLNFRRLSQESSCQPKMITSGGKFKWSTETSRQIINQLYAQSEIITTGDDTTIQGNLNLTPHRSHTKHLEGGYGQMISLNGFIIIKTLFKYAWDPRDTYQRQNNQKFISFLGGYRHSRVLPGGRNSQRV